MFKQNNNHSWEVITILPITQTIYDILKYGILFISIIARTIAIRNPRQLQIGKLFEFRILDNNYSDLSYNSRFDFASVIYYYVLT